MASSYPGAPDNLPTTRSDSTPMATTHAADHDNANAAINAIESTLGTNPQGAYTDVATRLGTLSGGVTTVTAANSSITVGGTGANPTVGVGTVPINKLAGYPSSGSQVLKGDGTWGTVTAAAGVNSVTAADTSIIIGGTATDPQLSTGIVPISDLAGYPGSSSLVLRGDGSWGAPASAGNNGLNGVFNPKDPTYGALGNGIANDTVAMQNCLNAAVSANGVMFIPAGTFLVSSLTIPASGNVVITGADKNKSIVQHLSTSSNLPIFYGNLNPNYPTSGYGSITIRNLQMVGLGQSLTGGSPQRRMALWVSDCTDLLLDNCIMTDFGDAATQIFPIGGGQIRVTNNRAQRCTNNTFAYNTLEINGSILRNNVFNGDIWFTGNYVTDGVGAGICATSSNVIQDPAVSKLRMFVTNNTVKNMNWTGIGIECGWTWSDVTISDNRTYNCATGICLSTGSEVEGHLSQLNYIVVANNILDSQLRLPGANPAQLYINGSNIITKNNFVRATKTALTMIRSQAGAYSENNITEGNIFTVSNGDSSITTSAMNLNFLRRCSFRNNFVGRITARVIGTQTVGAGGNLLVDTVEGWPTSGNIINKGTTFAFTAIVAPTAVGPPTPSSTDAAITLTAGGTFTDGDYVVVGGSGDGITLANALDCDITDNQIFLAGGNGIKLSGSTNTRVASNRILNPASQKTTGSLNGINLDGTNVNTELTQNYMMDTTGTATATKGVQITTGEAQVVLRNNLVDGIATAYSAGTASNVIMDRGNRTTKTAVPNGGTSTSTPGAVTTVNIAHGLVTTPTRFSVSAGDTNSRGAPAYYVTASATNITLNFASALTAATAYTWNWTAEA